MGVKQKQNANEIVYNGVVVSFLFRKDVVQF